MKTLLSFIAGIIAGVIGVFIYQVWGEPVLPNVEIEGIVKTLDRMDEDIATLYKITDRLNNKLSASRADTQPVNAWRPEVSDD
jgi:hypothetical protein